jgi:hypothetical protein
MSGPVCWICRAPASTREHRLKNSDLRAAFAKPSFSAPLLLHTADVRNRRVPSFKSDRLKFSKNLCDYCNSTRTQPHDLAWERLATELHKRKPATILRANRVFSYDTARHMLNVHLYFVKLFGCDIAEEQLPFDIQPFAEAVLRNKAHPGIYLRFGIYPLFDEPKAVGRTDLIMDKIGNRPGIAAWAYYVDRVGVEIMYIAPGLNVNGLKNGWHPRYGTKRLLLGDFSQADD